MVSNNLRKSRLERGFTQLELARKTRIAPGDISAMESGRKWPYAGWRRRIAAVLEIDEAELFPCEVKEDAKAGNAKTG